MASSRAPPPPSGRPPVGGRNDIRNGSQRDGSAVHAAMAAGPVERHSGRGLADVAAPGSVADPEVEDEAERLRKKRLSIFKSKYEVDEKIASRNKALINLVKSLGRTNLRQAEELAKMKEKVAALETQIARLEPLEALLAYMQQASDNKVLALLAADGTEPPATAGAPTLPPSEVMERLVTLLQTCGEGVDDLGPDILQSEAQACDMAAAGDDRWVDAIAEAERERHQGDAGELDGGRRVRHEDEEGADPDLWAVSGDDDAFADEIAAVGTQLHHECSQCGEIFTEQTNSDWACRWHPGHKKVDAAWNSVWSCCGLRHAMRGCSVGRHVPKLDESVEPGDDEDE